MESSLVVHDKMQELGDPSGRQDAQYWDAWFQIMSNHHTNEQQQQQSKKTFEWYTSPEEVIRVFSFHVNDRSTGFNSNPSLRILHPGSGTSLLPLKLWQLYPTSNHVIADISEIALEEIRCQQQQLHQIQEGVNESFDSCVQYVAEDLLQPNLSFDSNAFDCWIDKGFIDAIFSKENQLLDKTKANHLFRELIRIIKDDIGFVMIVSLAEEHSIQVMIDNIYDNNEENSYKWKSILHIWELKPISGNIIPLCFVLQKGPSVPFDKEENESIMIQWHHGNDNVTNHSTNKHTVLSTVVGLVTDSRERFLLTNSPSLKVTKAIHKLLVTIEIKPYDAELDLKHLGRLLQQTKWSIPDDDTGIEQKLDVLWQPISDTSTNEQFEIVPVAYGICKLVIRCVVPSEEVEDLVNLMLEWESEEIPDAIQSVDVDWTKTVPIGCVDDMLSLQKNNERL